MNSYGRSIVAMAAAVISLGVACARGAEGDAASAIRTPAAGAVPRINGPRVYGERPGRPFFYHLPVTGPRPIAIVAADLPNGLSLDAATGNISGAIVQAGESNVNFTATSAPGQATGSLKIVAGPTICLTPPMGWNSYDAFGDSVTEDETMSDAQYMKNHLLAHGWNYVVIDFRWYDSVGTYRDQDLTKDRAGATLAADEFGRMLPALNRFPSAANGQGFKPLADKLHAMGLKFGFHMMRGIPRQAVKAKTPIEGSTFTAADAGDTGNYCGWCPDMYGVRNNEAGQAWYDSMYRLYASWGLDFVKVDDLSNPYHKAEIEMIRKAIDKCGRPIVFSTSAGPTDRHQAEHIKTHANQWRISGDFWDEWGKLNHQFDLLNQWQGVGGPGHFPDADMIPFGHLSIRCWTNSKEHQTRFTRDEQRTLMSLWSLASSPLMLGCNLPDLDEWTLALLTDDEVLAIDQDALGLAAERVTQKDGLEAWVKDLKDGSKAVGLFNRSEADAPITAKWSDAGLSGQQKVRDVWAHKDLDAAANQITLPVPKHGVVLLRLSAL